MKKSTIIGALLIVGFLAIGAVGWMKSLTPYVSIAQAKSSPASVQVKGKLLKDTITYDKDNALNFYIVDESGQRLKVIYTKSKPANMEQATSVVVVGKYDGGSFNAENVLVKCPSKYQGATSGSN
jgi:cytochrome c-type biogenesis protein CcmE